MPLFPPGEDNGSAKLTTRIVDIIRSMHADHGWGATEIAKRLNMPRTTVRDVINRKTWIHL